jgi:hypothetical protein
VVQWVNVTYPDGVDRCADVAFSDAAGDVAAAAALGTWAQLDLQTYLMSTGKNYGPNLYGYVNTGVAPAKASCCADTMRIWNQVDGSVRDVDLVSPIRAVFANSSFAYATHTFDLVEVAGEVVALCMAQFEEDAALNAAKVDVVVAISMVTGAIVYTQAGDPYFSLWEQLGTTSTNPSDSVYKVGGLLFA